MGPESAVKELAPQLLSLLKGKGGGKGNRLNAKLDCLKELAKAEEVVKAVLVK